MQAQESVEMSGFKTAKEAGLLGVMRKGDDHGDYYDGAQAPEQSGARGVFLVRRRQTVSRENRKKTGS
jgi:hypothetical protein